MNPAFGIFEIEPKETTLSYNKYAQVYSMFNASYNYFKPSPVLEAESVDVHAKVKQLQDDISKYSQWGIEEYYDYSYRKGVRVNYRSVQNWNRVAHRCQRQLDKLLKEMQ
jgi:hypothetical protein